jgi:hypothetical protein
MSTDPSESSSLGATMPKPAPAVAFVPPKIGAQLGRYEIIATLGHGAMATVFRARDPQLGRDVALKVMGMVQASRSGAAERFRREAHAVAALKHPGIVEIYDYVDATDTEPSYIVAELIEGPTLRQLMEASGGRLLPEIATLVALPLLEALTVAHERGIVHRDVKPDNVMIETRGSSSRVVLTDFGIAHITGLESMTATGALVGSPAYMSPEQSRGHEVGPATDLWSVGTMLYEMVTGMVPFGGKDPYTVIASILTGKFRPPSRVVATVGPDFEALILRCLKTNPPERYGRAADLAADLRRFLQTSQLGVEHEALRRYIDDQEGTITALRPKVADAAMSQARACARRGQLARALAEIGHATAYVPNHPGARRLLRRLSAGRAVIRIGIALVGLAVFAAGAWLALPWIKAKLAPTPAPVVAPARPAASPVLLPPAVTPAAPALAPAPAEPAHPSARPAGPARPRGSRRAQSQASATAAAPAEAPAPAAAPAPPPPPVREVAPPKPGIVALFAKGGFCYPSLDDHAPAELMPVFHDVPAGKHKVYCSRTKGSAKEFAGDVDLPAGARIERTVTEQAGKLTLARPR